MYLEHGKNMPRGPHIPILFLLYSWGSLLWGPHFNPFSAVSSQVERGWDDKTHKTGCEANRIIAQ